jgi:hypothetical protein
LIPPFCSETMGPSKNLADASEEPCIPKPDSKGKGVDCQPGEDAESDHGPKKVDDATIFNPGNLSDRILSSAASLSAAFHGPGCHASLGNRSVSNFSGGEKEREGSGTSTLTDLPFASRPAATGGPSRSSVAGSQSFHSSAVLFPEKDSEFDAFLSPSMPLITPPLGAGAEAGTGSIAEQERHDGSQVIAILRDPTLDWDEADDMDDSISPEDASRLRSALFSGAAEHGIPWDHLLNFWPGQQEGFPGERGGQRPSRESLDAGSREAWLRDWKDVLLSYTDDVWGDLEALAVQAREEVGTIRESGSLPRLEALGRLRMILRHLRGSLED